MKLWLSKNSEIPLREQLTRQIMLAISSGDLQIGDKLPSVREIALRFKVHQNTVSNAYQWLEENGWVESRKGSGVFVADRQKLNISQKENELETLIFQLFYKASQLGYTQEEVFKNVEKYTFQSGIERILIVESNKDLEEIIVSEIRDSLDFKIETISLDDFRNTTISNNSIIAAMPKTALQLTEVLTNDSKFLTLKVNSVETQLKGQTKPQIHELIGIVSGWESFRRWSKTFLLAVGLENDSLLIRDTNEADYQKGLESCSFIIADSVSASKLPKSLDIRSFKLIADDSIEQIKNLIL